MSTTDKNDDGVWSEVDTNDRIAGATEEQPDDFRESQPPTDDSLDDVVEAKAKEVKRKSKLNPIVLVIGAIAIAGLGFGGYISYSLYTKMFGSAESVDDAAGGYSGLVDSTSSMPTMPSADVAAGAPAALPIGSGTMPTDIPATVNDQMVASEPVAAAPASTASAANPSASLALPAAGSPPAACPVVAPAPSCHSVAEKPARVSVDKRSAPRRIASSVKHKPSAKAAVPAAKTDVAVPVEKGPGKLSGYTVLAIEPKTGDHQQAWIRGSDGRMYIVREGDSFQGARVTSIRFADGAVKTTVGDVRK